MVHSPASFDIADSHRLLVTRELRLGGILAKRGLNVPVELKLHGIDQHGVARNSGPTVSEGHTRRGRVSGKPYRCWDAASFPIGLPGFVQLEAWWGEQGEGTSRGASRLIFQ
jgi:hypothetical protein